MSLGDELFALRTQRSTGRIGPVEYYQALARLLDTPREAITATLEPVDVSRTCIRRIGALLDDKFGATGTSLRGKLDSIREAMPADLREVLDIIANSEPQLSERWAPPSSLLDDLRRKCTWALPELVRQALSAHAASPNVTFKALFPARAIRGVVGKVRHGERPFSPGGRRVKHWALMDIDGHLEVLSSERPIQIEASDTVVVAGLSDHLVSLHYNESKGAAQPKAARAALTWLAGAIATTFSGAAIITATFVQLFRHTDASSVVSLK